MATSAAESAASGNHAYAVSLTSGATTEGSCTRGDAASDPVLAIDAKTMVWKQILDWIVAHR